MNTTTAAETNALAEVQSLSLPDMTIMNRGAAGALRMAQSFVIATDDDYQLAGEELGSIKSRINKLEDTRTGITGPMNKALKAINDLFRGPMETLRTAESAVKSSMLTYYDEQQRKADEVRRIAEEAAEAERRRIAEAARQVELAAAAERKRIADEAAAAQAAAQAEQQRLARVAAEAAAQGNAAAQAEAERAAEASRQQAILEEQQAQQRDQEAQERAFEQAAALRMEQSVISASVTSIDTKATGTSVKGTVDFEVTSMISLVKYIAQNPNLISLVVADNVKLRAYVRGLGINTELPGVRVFQKRTMSARAA
jgi:colicin import membrane protein